MEISFLPKRSYKILVADLDPPNPMIFFDVHKLESFWIIEGNPSFLAKLISIKHIKSIIINLKMLFEILALYMNNALLIMYLLYPKDFV